MTATADPDTTEAPATKSKRPLLLGLVLAIAGGAGGFMAVQTGLLWGASEAADARAEEAHHGEVPELGTPHFVALGSMIINLPPEARHDVLRLTATLDVAAGYVSEVEAIKPRIVDVLNSYLRAVDVADLEDRAALNMLRSQMLRRVQVLTGDGRVHDLLIEEFIFN